MPKVHLPSLPEIEQRSPGGKFHSYCRNVSLALGGVRNAGTWGGGHPFDLQVRRIPPGASVCPYHSHLAQWEFFVVQSGTATVRVGAELHVLPAGSVFVHPPGEAHQLTNAAASGDLTVLIITDNPFLDACHYPDSNKWNLRPPGMIFRATPAGYFDGEEAGPPPDASSYQPPPVPAPPPLAPFAERCVQIDALPWEPWTSPKGKFRAASKELSVAVGAKRNTPSGLGGHPFDLELGKVAPGESPCVFHSHAAQWECYYFLSGSGTVRTPAGLAPVVAGDVVMHPPGEAHQFFNTGDTDLLYYLVADNPPSDYWHYPDSNKWGLREPRQFFRINPIDYWDGEE